MKTASLLLIFAIALAGCGRNQSSQGHLHGPADTAHDHEGEAATAPVISHTVFTDEFELFVEFPALVVGELSRFAAHFTQLDGYKPVGGGELAVSIIKGGKGLRHTVESPSSPGIFRPALQPKEPGVYSLIFDLVYDGKSTRFEIGDTEVFQDSESARHSLGGEGSGEGSVESSTDEVTFLKEQAWKTEFAVRKITLQPFHSVIHTSGRVKNPPQSQTIVNAPAEGRVNLYKVRGESVKKGEILVLISGVGLEDDLNLRYNELRLAFEKSRADYLRTRALSESQVISEGDFLEIRARYLRDSLRYHQYAGSVSGGGLKLRAPMDGFISDMMVQNGEAVQTGETLLRLTRKEPLLIEAWVSQSDLHRIEGIFDAHFLRTAEGTTRTLDDLDGRLRAGNAFVGNAGTRIPVTFEVRNNDGMVPGMYLEVFLLTDRKEKTLVIPHSAIIEEQGQFFVFVQSGGESFLKTRVGISASDGIRAEIGSGLRPGDRIVTKGAFQIKLAALAGDLPLHGHTH